MSIESLARKLASVILLPFRRPRASVAVRLLVASLLAAAPQRLNSAFGEEQSGAEDTAWAAERIAELRTEVAHHDALYFREAAPEISDAAYDRLKRELQMLERSHPRAAALSPPAGVGDDRTGRFPEYRHRVSMLSLDKAYAEADLEAYEQRVAAAAGSTAPLGYVIEPKLDGMAVSLVYEKGWLVAAASRGDGSRGEEITANIRSVAGLPLLLMATAGGPPPELVELRGELFVSWEDFRSFNRKRESEGEAPFSHPRALAADSAKLSDPDEVAERPLSIAIFGYGAWEPADGRPATQAEFLERVSSWGLPVVPLAKSARGLEELKAVIAGIERDRWELPFPSDGVVVKLDDRQLQDRMGLADTAPRWAIAWKFPAERVETRLRGIAYQVGRTGRITPVAELEPVELGGSLIRRATLWNFASLQRLDLRLGDWLFLEKTGEIIPKVLGPNLERRPGMAQPIVPPSRCPACETPLERAGENAIADRCGNEGCPERLTRAVAHFASSGAVGIEGLGLSTARQLVTDGRLRSLADIYSLDPSTLQESDGSLSVSSAKLLEAIERSRAAPLWRYLSGLGIPEIGSARAKALAQVYPSLTAFAELSEADFEPGGIAADCGVGPSARSSLIGFLSKRENRDRVSRLAAALRSEVAIPAAQRPIDSQPFAGAVFAITGRLSRCSREEAIRLIEAAGGSARGQLSSRVDYLLVGENPGGKLAEAEALGIERLDEDEWWRRLERE